MSTANFYDIPDFYREQLNRNYQEQQEESVTAYSEQEEKTVDVFVYDKTEEAKESVLVEGEEQENADNMVEMAEHIQQGAVEASSCRGRNCKRPRCEGRNCPPPGCEGRNCPPPRRHPYPQYPFHPCPMGSYCRRGDNMMPPMPFYRTYPGNLRYQEEMDDLQDMDKLQEQYPQTARMIRNLVDEQADRMDYDGSMMFDEAPDKVMMERMVNGIYERLMRQQTDGSSENECELCREPVNEGLLKELITVLLFQEMFRRRCRNRRCNIIFHGSGMR